MPMNCLECGKGLTRGERQNSDKKCCQHSLLRRNRCPLALMRTWQPGGKWPRSSGQPESLSGTLLPRALRNEFPSLTSTFSTSHKHGGGIWCLDARPDVRAVQDVARCCFDMTSNGSLDETSALCFVLAANRIWDPPTCADLKTLIQQHPAFTLQNMRSFLKQVEAKVLSGTAVIGCPTGCAGAHSGLTWLRYLCSSTKSWACFKEYVGHLIPQLRNTNGGPADTQAVWLAISKPHKTGIEGRMPKHHGTYYKMQTFRVCKHAFCTRHPRRAKRSACPDSKYLWNDVLLKYAGGGANRKSIKHGLRSWKAASRFCKLMRKVKSNFCMCDLACWICLA
jgi:hypothetical protein